MSWRSSEKQDEKEVDMEEKNEKIIIIIAYGEAKIYSGSNDDRYCLFSPLDSGQFRWCLYLCILFSKRKDRDETM